MNRSALGKGMLCSAFGAVMLFAPLFITHSQAELTETSGKVEKLEVARVESTQRDHYELMITVAGVSLKYHRPEAGEIQKIASHVTPGDTVSILHGRFLGAQKLYALEKSGVVYLAARDTLADEKGRGRLVQAFSLMFLGMGALYIWKSRTT